MGHGMDTPGKCTPPFEDGHIVKEAVQNYAVGAELIKQLEYNNIACIITNTDQNHDMSLNERVSIENASGADIFISIHKNAGPVYEWSDIHGTETYCYKFGYNGERLAKCIQTAVINRTADKNRGVKEGNFMVIRETKAPAVLVELGFMTNYDDALDMTDSDEVYLYACGVADGVCNYFGIRYKQLHNDIDKVAIMDELIASMSDELDELRELVSQLD